jgi:hypothetical protein
MVSFSLKQLQDMVTVAKVMVLAFNGLMMAFVCGLYQCVGGYPCRRTLFLGNDLGGIFWPLYHWRMFGVLYCMK